MVACHLPHCDIFSFCCAVMPCNMGAASIQLNAWVVMCLQITTHWPSQNVAMFPKIGPGYYSIDKNDKAAQDAYMERLNKFKVRCIGLPVNAPADTGCCATCMFCEPTYMQCISLCTPGAMQLTAMEA